MFPVNTIKISKAEKLNNYGRPKNCIKCSKMMKPELHIRTLYEGFGITELATLYKDNCEWCGNEFEYWK